MVSGIATPAAARLSELEKIARSRCRSVDLKLPEAIQLCSRLIESNPPPSTIHTFNVIISRIQKLKHYPTVISLYNNMALSKKEQPSTDIHTHGILIDCFCKLGQIDSSFGVLCHVLKAGIRPNTVSLGGLLNGLCSFGRMEDAGFLFDRMPQMGCARNAVAYGALVKGFCRAGDVGAAVELHREMERHGRYCAPNVIIYNTIIDGLCRQGRLRDAFELFDEMGRRGVPPNANTYTCIIRELLISGRWKVAVGIFMKMVMGTGVSSPTSVTVGSLIDGLCRHGRIDEARKLFDLLIKEQEQEGGFGKPDVMSYSMLMQGYYHGGFIDESLNFFERMKLQGLVPDLHCLSILIDGLCKNGRIDEALDVLREIPSSSRLNPNAVIVYNSILNELVLRRRHEDVSGVVDEMAGLGISPVKSTYNTLICGFCKLGNWEEAASLFFGMIDRRILPDVITFSTLLDSLCKNGMTREAHSLLHRMILAGVEPDVVCYTSLMDGYCLSSSMEKAERVFDFMVGRGVEADIICYSILIKGYCRNTGGGRGGGGNIDKAMKLLWEIPAKGLEIDHVIISTLVLGLIQAGRSVDARKLHHQLVCTKFDAAYDH